MNRLFTILLLINFCVFHASQGHAQLHVSGFSEADLILEMNRDGVDSDLILSSINRKNQISRISKIVASAATRENPTETSVLLRMASRIDINDASISIESAIVQSINNDDVNRVIRLIRSIPDDVTINLNDTNFIKIFSLPGYAMLLIRDNGSQIRPVLELLKETPVEKQNKAVIIEHLESHLTISKGRYFEEYEIEVIAKEIIKSLDE